MTTELILKFDFEASHSLEGYEAPHPHLWRLEFSVTGAPIQGRMIDIVSLRTETEKIVKVLEKTYLNDNVNADRDVQKFPTCETLSVYFKNQLVQLLDSCFFHANPSISLGYVLVSIHEMDGIEMGAVKLHGPWAK